jgi:hypothetical protein
MSSDAAVLRAGSLVGAGPAQRHYLIASCVAAE